MWTILFDNWNGITVILFDNGIWYANILFQAHAEHCIGCLYFNLRSTILSFICIRIKTLVKLLVQAGHVNFWSVLFG